MKYSLLSICLLLLLGSCATEKLKIREGHSTPLSATKAPWVRDVYLIGDAGLSPENGFNPVLHALSKVLDTASSTSMAVFLGDNIYPAGMPSRKDDPDGYSKAEFQLQSQVSALEGFAGTPLFIPGNHDWYSDGPKGLKRQEDFLERVLDDKDVFQPEKGCGYERIRVGEDLTILVIDSQWYISDWDRFPDMNRDCALKDRGDFWETLEGEIKKNRDRVTLIAIHNPILNYGSHAGQYSFRSHMFPFHSPVPLPVLGTVYNELRRSTGASHADDSHPRYRELRNRLLTVAQYSQRVVIASGHEHSLQYIVEKNTPQIVSGSGAKRSANRLKGGSRFATGDGGFARLSVFDDGSSTVRYYVVNEAGEAREAFRGNVTKPRLIASRSDFDATDLRKRAVKASIYRPEEVEKSGIYQALWGKRYRSLYAREVMAPVALLDTLYGGLKPVREGGGHQSFSLRLVNPEGKPYVMRALRKSAEKYLQAIAYQDQYIIGEFEDTATERFLLDFYTGSNPYAPFAVAPLARAIGVSHTRPKLFYVPRQPALGGFNDDYGDRLYMIEEHVSSPHASLENFGSADKILSTVDMLEEVHGDSEHRVDQAAYVRARLFDMLLGDWDRHPDQWRWSRHQIDDENWLYRPIPRDRDQVFSIMGDGLVMGAATALLPSVKLFEGFGPEIRSVKGLNSSPKTFALDMALLSGVSWEVWESQARLIQQRISKEVAAESLAMFPPELRDPALYDILESRKSRLVETARAYFEHLNTTAVLVATEKEDRIELSESDGHLRVTFARIKDGKPKKPYASYQIDPALSREAWVYGLDDDDEFVVRSKPASIRLRLIGGGQKDSYQTRPGLRGIHMYEHSLAKSEFEKAESGAIHLRRDYATTTYRMNDIKANSWTVLPSLGANPDDGFRFGFNSEWRRNGLVRNPYTSLHRLKAQAYLATSGWDVEYRGEKAALAGRWNLAWHGRYTSPNYAVNFFGFGNSTSNMDEELGRDFNRVRLQQLKAGIGGVRRGKLGSALSLGAEFQSFRVAGNEGRFIEDYQDLTGFEDRSEFLLGNIGYRYSNFDDPDNPSMGMSVNLRAEYALRQGADGGFGVIRQELGYIRPISSNGRLLVSTQVFTQWNITRDYEFYQAASIGARTGLRGYRFQRFSGQTAFSQSTDLRWNLRTVHTGLFPTQFGLFVGYDYGRVWQPGDPPSGWHHSAGGGFAFTAARVFTFRAGAFGGEDGLRIGFTTGASW